MKRCSWKNLVSLLLIFVILLTTVFGGGLTAVFADNSIFKDDFTSSSLSGWTAGTVGQVRSGVYTLGGQEYNLVDATKGKSSVMMSADVAVNVGADASGIMQNSTASLVINADKDLKTGYEFSIGVTKSGVTYARLYLLGDESTERILVQKNKNIAGVTGGTLSAGKTYNLSVGCSDGVINCFINGELVISFEDSTYKSGYCGIATNWSASVFDNVVVTPISEKKVERISVKNAPASISLLGTLSFDVYVEYEGNFFQSETIPSTDSRVIVSDFSRTECVETVKVTVGGKSTSFKLTVTAVSEDELVYSDNFSSNTVDNYNNYRGDTTKAYINEMVIANGVVSTATPSIPVGFNGPLIAKYTLKDSFIQNIGTAYKVSVDAVINTDTSGTETTRRTTVELSTHTNKNGDVYKYVIDSQGKATLSVKPGDGSATVTLLSTSVTSVSDSPFELGKKFNMSMALLENIIVLTYNNVEILYYTVEDLENSISPKVYISVTNGKAAFDNLKVFKLEKYSTDAVSKIKVYSAVDNKPITGYTGKQFSTESLYLVVTYAAGRTRTVGLTTDLLSGYDSTLKKDQTVTVTYGKASAKINFKYSKYLFSDNFDYGLNPMWSITSQKNITAGAKNGNLRVEWNGNKDSAQISLNTEKVSGSDMWRDYQITAEITFNNSMTKTITAGSFFSFMFRKTGVNYYDLRLITRSGNVQLQLYRYMNGKNQQMLSLSQAQLNNMLPKGKTVGNGVTLKLSALCKGNNIYIYVDDILAATYTELLDEAPQYGGVGMKLFKASGTVENFTVEEKKDMNITAFEVEGVKNNTFELYEGFEICPNDYNLKCYDADGTVLIEPLTAEMLSPYDNLKVGKQNIKIKALGVERNATVIIKQREDYIKSLDEELKDLKVKKLTLEDKETVYDLRDRYDELSGYEITKLSEKARENMLEARDKMETLVYPEIADKELLYFNDFNEEEDCNDDDWFKGYTTSKGDWFFSNGTFRLEQLRHNIYYGAWRVYSPLYAQFNSVSARFKMLNEGEYPGIVFNVSKEGHYQARLKMDYYDDEGNLLPMLQILRNDTRVFALYLSGYGVDIKVGEWITMMMTLVDGTINVYVNDVLIVSFDDSESLLHHTEGRAGIYASNGNVLFDNFAVRGTVVEERTSAVSPTPTTYKDDFEDEKENSDPSHWVEENDKDNFKTVKKNGNTYYGTSYTKDYTYSWLHIFDSDPTVKLKFMTESEGKTGQFGFILRMSPEVSYAKVCYDFAKSKFYLVETQAERDCVINTTYSDVETKLEKGKWYNLEIVADGTAVSVRVDGIRVLDIKNISQVSHGRVGVLASGASIYIDDVDCTFTDGGVAQDGVVEYVAVPDIYGGAMDPVYIDNGEMVFAGGSYVVYSDDYGKTSQLVCGDDVDEEQEGPEALVDRFEAMSGNDGYVSVLKLHDGSFLMVKQLDDVTGTGSGVYKSTDNCHTWKKLGYVEENYYDQLRRRNYTFHNNSLTEYQLADGTWRIFLPISYITYGSNIDTSSDGHYTVVFYSDDGGNTWTASKNDTRDVMLGWTAEDSKNDWAESKVIQCSDGSMRMYYSRGWLECMSYTESFDNGETWSGHYPVPEMQTAKASHNIVHDKSTGDYYMIWVNNNPVKYQSNFSRTRLSLARSKDGKTWEFLCDLERMQEELYGLDFNNSTPIMQIVDPAIEVTEDYVYVTFARSDGTDPTKVTGLSNYHNSLRMRLVRLEKDKLQPQEWGAANISDMLFVSSIEIKETKTRFGLGDVFSHAGGTAVLVSFDGSRKEIDTSRLIIYDEPDTFELGKHTVTLYNNSGVRVSYDIEVLPKYIVNWTVSGPGSVEPQEFQILEGDTLTATLTPDGFSNKVKSVTVNGKAVKVKRGTLEVKDIREDLDIVVVFGAKGFLDYAGFIALIALAVLLGGGIIAVAVISIIKKKNPFKLIASVFAKLFRRKKND